jgi:hypothetical protein
MMMMMMMMTARATATIGRRRPPAPLNAVLVVLLATILVVILPRSAEGFQAGPAAPRFGRPQAQGQAQASMFVHRASVGPSSGEVDTAAVGAPYPKRALATAAWVTTTVMIPAASAWAASGASEGDEYVYGSVDAPIGLAVGVGILAIATAALPVLLRGGEEAFEEIRERDEGTFGSPDKNKDVLKSRRK